MDKSYHYLFRSIIVIILICQLCACSIGQSDPSAVVSTQDTTEKTLDSIPPEAIEKVRGLLTEIEAEYNDYSLYLIDEADEILQFDKDVFVVLSKWEYATKASYLSVLVAREKTDWTAVFLGENAVEFTSDGIKVIETGTLRTLSFQGTALVQGFLFYLPGRYMRVMLNAEHLTDNIGTDQQSLDLKKADGDGAALWLYAVHNPERPGSVMLLSDSVFADEDQNDLVFLYVKELSEDYDLICGDLHVKGSDLLHAISQSDGSPIDP